MKYTIALWAVAAGLFVGTAVIAKAQATTTTQQTQHNHSERCGQQR